MLFAGFLNDLCVYTFVALLGWGLVIRWAARKASPEVKDAAKNAAVHWINKLKK